MAKRVYTGPVSDVSGEEIAEGGESVTFAYKGAEYEIHLTPNEAAEFDRAIGEYVKHARRTGGRRRPAAAAAGGPAPIDKEQAEAVRRWVESGGLKVSAA